MTNNDSPMRSICIAAVIAGIILTLNLNAQTSQYNYAWGKQSYISEPSSTLDGVQSLANWIWDSGEANPKNYYLLVRKTFRLDALPRKADTYISAYAYADVYINGKLLERCPMNCDPQFQCYDKFNISNYLKKGENCITAIVQNFGVGLHSQTNARGGFFFQAKLQYSQNKSVDLLSDASWKVTHAKAWNTQSNFREPNAHLIGFIEDFDARLWPEGWHNVSFNDASWQNATVIGKPPVAPWNNIVVTERPQLLRKIVKPVRTWQNDSLIVYDFGKEIVGYPQFTINASQGGIEFETGTCERLDSNGVPLIRASGDHSNNYTTKHGVQSWQPFTWMGFRYFSIDRKTGIRIQDISAELSCYNYDMDGSSFECSDPQLNHFWDIGRYTMQLNSIDTYQDPWREHTQYIAGDSRYMQIYGYYAFGKSSGLLSAYNILSGAESQRWRNDGAVRSRYPTDYFMQPGSSTYLADYQLEWVLMMHEYFMYFGKDKLIEGLYPNLKKAMDYYQPFIDKKTGLLANLPGWIVLDWPDTYYIEKKNIVTALNCLYYGALNAAAAIATDFNNDTLQAAKWKKQAATLKENINKELWSEKALAYVDSYEGSKIGQQTQVYALTYGLADSSKKASISILIMDSGKASEESFAYWTLKSMFNEGYGHWALNYMRKNWGAQTRLSSFNGAWHEGWNLPWGSTSHAWSSGPTALLSQKVLGVEPTGYGWKTFSVKPFTGDLMWAKGNVASAAGNILVCWQRTAGNLFTLKLSVPKGTTANVYLPATQNRSIKINGKTVADMPGVKLHVQEGQRSVLTVNEGDYEFECNIDN